MPIRFPYLACSSGDEPVSGAMRTTDAAISRFDLTFLQQTLAFVRNAACTSFVSRRFPAVWVKISSNCAHNGPRMNDTLSDQTELLRSLALERISPQWADFLGLLSDALGAQLESAEYRQLLVGLGERFAGQNPLPACTGLEELAEAMNAVWKRMRWGYVGLSDQRVQLELVHRACPLPAALQLDADVAGGFLEGVYGVWLKAAGAPADLALMQLQGEELPMHMAFALIARS